MPDYPDKIVAEFLKLRLLQKWSIKSIKATHRSQTMISKILLNEIKRQIDNKKEQNIFNRLAKHRKLKEIDKEYINSLVQINITQNLTASSISKKVMNNFSEMDKVSSSTIIRWLRNDLRWSFKKLERKHAPATTTNSKRLLLEGTAIQKKLLELDVEVIFIDDFNINFWHHEFSGWTKVGQKGYIMIEIKEFLMSFICSVFTKRVLGLIGVKESTTSDIIVFYLKRMFEELRKSNGNKNCECAIIWDNASVYSNSTVCAFIASSWLRILSILLIVLYLIQLIN